MDNLKNKTLLVTGGTGSFGTKLTEHLLNKKIPLKKIIIFSRDEDKQHRMKLEIKSNKVEFVIGDIRDKDSLRSAFLNVDFIFHAAALKHVPSCEFFPMEAIKTNVLGTDNVLSVAQELNVKKVVLLSTDKACKPINAMGCTKMLMEKIMLSKAKKKQGNTTFSCVRYGNVLFSRGSVIPLFFKQIKEGKDITITHPKMTRFLMSLSKATDLVMYALQNSKNGDIFIHKAKSSYILDIAKACLKITKSNNKITTIGIREGEKISETLITSDELSIASEHGQFWRIPYRKQLKEDDFYLKSQNSLDIQEYNSSLIKLENIDSICKIIKENSEYIKNKIF